MTIDERQEFPANTRVAIISIPEEDRAILCALIYM